MDDGHGAIRVNIAGSVCELRAAAECWGSFAHTSQKRRSQWDWGTKHDDDTEFVGSLGCCCSLGNVCFGRPVTMNEFSTPPIRALASSPPAKPSTIPLGTFPNGLTAAALSCSKTFWFCCSQSQNDSLS